MPHLAEMDAGPRRSRAWLLVINTVLVALLAGSALFAVLGRGPQWLAAHRTPGDMVGAPAIRPDMNGVSGVNLDPSELEGPDLEPRLAQLETGGMRWVRFRLPWDEIEPERGQYQWEKWDRVFARLAEHPQIEPLVVLDGSPAWARPPQDAANPFAPPQTRAHFGAFAAAAARRYGAQIRYYQIWNEPNIAPHWGARPVDPAGYLGLLREGTSQVRAVDPDAQIVLAALAPTIEAGGANQSDIAFLEALYRLDARPWFDIVAGEPYGFSQPPDALPGPRTLNFARVALLREVMVRHNDTATPVWATAFGWNALPDDWRGPASPWGQVSEVEQAAYAADALDIARSRWSWLGPLFWATDCPTPPGSSASARPADDSWRGFALCTGDSSQRPAWQALVERGTGARALAPGEHALTHPALQYSPGWRVTPSGADPSSDGDRLVFAFYGTDLALRIQGGPFWAYYRITVDGLPANALPRDEEGRAYLVLDDPQSEQRVVPVARNLAVGNHQATLEAVGGWDQWALQGILVSVAQPTGSGAVWFALLAMAGVTWLIVAWPWRPKAAGWLTKAQDWGASVPPPVQWTVVALVGVAFAWSTRTSIDALLALGLLALFIMRPPLMLPLIAAAIPLWNHPKPVVNWQFSVYELFIWIGTAALAVRWLLFARREKRSQLRKPAASSRTPGSQFVAGSQRPGWWTGALTPPGWLRSLADQLSLGGFDWPVLALLVSGLVSTLAASQQGVALRELRTVFIDAALFYVLITRILRTAWNGSETDDLSLAKRRVAPPAKATVPSCMPAGLWPLIDGLVVGLFFVSGLALWQLVTGQGRIDVEGVWRVRAFYGSPNNLALVLDRGVPLALAVALFGRAPGPRSWLYGIAAPVMALACAATFSKGALLLGLPAGVGVVVVLGAWRARKRLPLAFLGSAVVLAAASLVFLFRTPRFADLLNFEQGTSFIRLKLWQGAWQMALDHPWLGVGPDNFLYAYRTRYVLPSAWEELNLSHPHNILLDLWTRLGVLGFVVGLWAVAFAFQCSVRLVRRGSGDVWPLALGLLGGLAATLAHGLIDNSLFLIDLMALFMLALGMLQVMSEVEGLPSAPQSAV